MKPVSRDSGQERIPLVGVRSGEGAKNGFLRAGSCLGDPQVRNHDTNNIMLQSGPSQSQHKSELSY